MGRYLYNGVELPALPEWDKEQYPYAWIRGVECEDGTVTYYLRVSSDAIIYKKTIDFETLGYQYVYWQYGTGNIYDGVTTKDDEWVLFNGDAALDNYFNVDNFVFSWVNHDVINEEDGTVYQAASDPIPVLTYDPTAMLLGWLTGRKVAGMRQRKPVAYLYNGVQLPALPEWDRETYPYAAICFIGNGETLSYLFLSSAPLSYRPYKVGITKYHQLIATEDCSALEYVYDTTRGDTDWILSEDNSGEFTKDGTVCNLILDGSKFWTNYTILNYDDGTVHQVATDPVPVYE